MKDVLGQMAQGGGATGAQMLISQGVNLNEKMDVSGLTLLHVAAGHGDIDFASTIISNGANVNAKSNNGNASLHQAVGASKVEMVRFLVSKGADVNAKGEDDWTPLHWAAQEDCNVEVTKILVFAGANLHARTTKGRTPLEMAEKFGNMAIVECLSNIEREMREGRAGQERKEVMPNNDELSEIEAVVSECETEIQSGTLCVESVLQHMRNAPNTDMTKAQEYAKEYIRVKGAGRIDIHRLAGLKKSHSDNPRVHELGSRAAKCYLQLSEIWLTAGDKLMTPDFKSAMKIPSIQEELDKAKKCWP